MAFSEFLIDLQREMGRQAFLYAVELHGNREKGTLPPKHFINLLKTACGWRLPEGILDRLNSLYCTDPISAAEATALVALQSERLKGSTAEEAAKTTSASILANIEHRARKLGEHQFNYTDFLAFQDVLSNLHSICNLIQEACDIKQGSISPDDFKVANYVIGLGSRMSRRQVEIVFQVFDLNRDGFISAEDAVSVVGLGFVNRLVAKKGRDDKLTFAPPPNFTEGGKNGTMMMKNGNGSVSGTMNVNGDNGMMTHKKSEEESLSLFAHLKVFLQKFGMACIAGGIGATAVYPIDL